jgi:hypothetical protein
LLIAQSSYHHGTWKFDGIYEIMCGEVCEVVTPMKLAFEIRACDGARVAVHRSQRWLCSSYFDAWHYFEVVCGIYYHVVLFGILRLNAKIIVMPTLRL